MQQQQQQQTIAPEEKKSVQFTPSTTTPQQHTQQHSASVHERSDLLMKTTVAKDLNQIRGLFLKSFFLQLKQYKTNLCQLLFPVMCLVFIFILQAVLNTLVAGFLSSAGTDGIVRINSTSVELSQLMLQAKQLQTGKNITFSPPEAIYVTSDKVGYLDSIGFGVLSPNLTLSNGFLKNIAPFSRMSSTLAVNGTFNSTGWVSIPYSVSSPFTEETSMDEVIYDHMGAVSKPENLDAVGGYIVRQLSISDKVSTKTTFNYTVEYDYDEKTQFCKSYIKKTPYSFAIKSCKDAIGVGLQNWMNDAFIRNITGSYRIKTYTAQMPYDTEVSTFQIADLLGFFFFPMILCLLLPSFSFTIVLEKQFKLREMMKLMGMKMRYYFLVTYVFFYLLYCISAALFIIFCLIFKFRFITQTNPFMLFLFFIAWGNTLVSFGFLLSSFIGKTIVATIISYLIVLIMPMVGIILETAVYTNVPEARFGLLTIFPLQITHFVYATSSSCNSFECLKKVSDIYDNQSVFYSLIYMVGMSVVYFILGLYFDAVVPQPFGVSRHPLFFLEWIWKPFTRNRVKSKNGASKNRVSPCSKDERQDEEIIVDAVKGESLDSDVAEEYFKVNPPGYDNKQMTEHVKKMREEYGVVLFNLEKTYGMNRAVKGTCLTIGKSECFGLLGMNGAGKSTTISMLSGMFGPSAGTAYVYNKDIRYDMESIHKMMGLTAQFDILYPDLTCEEHLLFYSRLKGIQLKHEKEHVQSLLRQVGLDNDTLKTKWSPNSSSLSGGMKRRLSIAISLVGDPNVILLDEPTTGLDPLSKRHLWDIILAQKKNRTIILTTHSMEEADVLCDRITIMNKGSFKCLGSGVRLKSKFGDGFLLTVSYGLTSQETAEKYVYDYVPEAQKDLTLTGTTTFKIPFFNTNKQIGEEQIADNRSIAGLFQHMESGKLNHGIKEWALNQVSLEQVFLNIVSKDSEKRSQAEKDVKCSHKRSSVLIRQCLC